MENDFVTIAEFPNVSEAQLCQELLEENGIDTFLPGENAAALQYPPTREVRLQVPASEVERARMLLDEAMADGDGALEEQNGNECAEEEEAVEEDEGQGGMSGLLFLAGATVVVAVLMLVLMRVL